MSEHAPGPYRAEGGTIKAVSHGRWFAIAHVVRGLFTAEGRAGTAALLAAAPELLESLKEALEVMGTWDDAEPGWATTARAAIAKATGG
jgi:hypothetical protein